MSRTTDRSSPPASARSATASTAARRPPSSAPGHSAAGPAGHLLRLQAAAGNAAVARGLAAGRVPVQGLFVSPTGSSFNLAGHAKTYYSTTLTPAKRAAADRYRNDPYRVYTFATLLDAMKWVDGIGAPLNVVEHPRPQQGGAATAADPHPTAYDSRGYGGAETVTVPNSFLMPVLGFAATKPHASNWAQFVEVQFAAIRQRCAVPGPIPATTAGWLDDFHRRALVHADRLDSLDPAEMAPAALATTNLALVHARKHLVGLVTHAGTQVEAYVQRVSPGLAVVAVPRAMAPVWGPLRAQGIGSSVQVVFSSDTEEAFAVGSKPDSASPSTGPVTTPWRNVLHRRKSGDWSRTLFVQGHLLNDHLGGPGLEYNLVPLTNEGNEIHKATVEHFVKRKVLQMRREQQDAAAGHVVGNPIASIRYEVTPTWPAAQRGNTATWVGGRAALALVLAACRGAAAPAPYPTATTTWTSLVTAVAQGTAPAAYLALLAPSGWELLRRMAATIQRPGESMTLDAMEQRFARVTDLWAFEDQHVPLGLTLTYETTRRDGTVDPDGKLNTWIPNTIDQMPLEQPVDVWSA